MNRLLKLALARNIWFQNDKMAGKFIFSMLAILKMVIVKAVISFKCNMANISKQHISENHEKIQKLFEKFVFLNKKMIDNKFSLVELEKVTFVHERSLKSDKNGILSYPTQLLAMIIVILLTLSFGFLSKFPILDVLVDNTLGIRCVIPNNYFVWEATRPVTDCGMCENVTEVLNLRNCTRKEFSEFAYTSKPVVIRNSASHWPAMKNFNFEFFKELFETIEGSYESVEEECQFLTFKSDFLSLRDVFNMKKSRLELAEGENPWYVGWSVCHPEILSKMRQHYPRPHFLPEEAEHSHLDYIFMGYQQGAVMHLDYISRLMWQAQIIGRKTWKLVPPPECDHICNRMSVTVEAGDIVLLDTRQWYHDTTVDDGLFSLTVSSEYG